jgi:hypothetical protein
LALRQSSRKTKSKQYGIANIEVKRADGNRSPDTRVPLRISRAILDAQLSCRTRAASSIDNRPEGFFDRHAPAWGELCGARACASITRHHSIQAKEATLVKPSDKTRTAPVSHQK